MERKQIEARSRFWRRAHWFYVDQIAAGNCEHFNIDDPLMKNCVKVASLFQKYWGQL